MTKIVPDLTITERGVVPAQNVWPPNEAGGGEPVPPPSSSPWTQVGGVGGTIAANDPTASVQGAGGSVTSGSGSQSVALGPGNTASGVASASIGGTNNLASDLVTTCMYRRFVQHS